MILYSITAHESPECLVDLIQNIAKYNADNWTVIVNCTPSLYGQIGHWKLHRTLFCPIIEEREYWSYGILQAHVHNWQYVHEIGMDFKYFVTMASNSMFVTKSPIMEGFDCFDRSGWKTNGEIDESGNRTGWNWKKFNKNLRLIEWLEKNLTNCRFTGLYHEGAVYSRKVADAVFGWLSAYNLSSLIDEPVPAEEILPPMLEYAFFNYNVKRLCRIYWEHWSHDVPPEKILQLLDERRAGVTEECMVKWVPRRIDSPARFFINNEL